MREHIAELARRVEDDPFFLASALRAYAQSEGLAPPDLATFLGCPVDALPRLGLCRRPRPTPPFFRQDVDRIAARFGIAVDALVQVVRRADALAAVRRVERGGGRDEGWLMAARDREDEPRSDAEGP